jgi:hypothetical protein
MHADTREAACKRIVSVPTPCCDGKVRVADTNQKDHMLIDMCVAVTCIMLLAQM